MKISNEKLGIGIPCSFPHIPFPFFDSFVTMKKPDFIYIPKLNGPIDTLRNDIVEKALGMNCSHLIMMDVDQVYHPETIPALLSRRLPVVGAAVCRRYPPFDPIIMKREEVGYSYGGEWNPDGLVECDATGTGCILFDMEVFRKIPAPWFEFTKDANGLPVGEDIGFCEKLKAAGYKVFVDCTVPAGHLTTMIVNKATYDLYSAMKAAKAVKDRALGVADEAA
jgi:hypothetical protein